MRTPFLVAALCLAGCSGSVELPGLPTPTSSDLIGTVWTDTCADTVYWVRFNEDQSVDYSTSGPEGWQNDGTDTWSLSGSVLTLSWTDGYRVATFDLSGGLDGRIDGESSALCEGVVSLERQP